MEAGRVSQKRRFPKAMLLENSQVNLQHGRCKLTKRRCCVEPAASMPLLPVRLSSLLSSCTFLYNCLTTSFSIEKLAAAWNHGHPCPF